MDRDVLRNGDQAKRCAVLLVFSLQKSDHFPKILIPGDMQIEIIVVVIHQDESGHLLEILWLKLKACFDVRVDLCQPLSDQTLPEPRAKAVTTHKSQISGPLCQ